MNSTNSIMQTSELILKSCDIPAVPMVAVRILRLVDDPKTEINDLQDAIMSDQALAARVIRIANRVIRIVNSAYYGLRRDIDTISEAIVMIGFETIKNLALAVSTREVYKSFGLLEQKLWEHSIGVSIAAGLIAREANFPKADEAMVAGLLHDIGKVVMNNSQPQRFSLLTQRVYDERVTYSRREKEIFGFGHAEVGGLLAQRWGFPEVLCDVITRHHSNNHDGLFDGEPSRSMLCYIVALADALCVRLGVGYRGPMADLDLMDWKWKEILGITDDRFSEIVETFKQAYIQEKLLYQF